MKRVKQIFSISNEYKFIKNEKVKLKIIQILGFKIKFKTNINKIKKQNFSLIKLKRYLHTSLKYKNLKQHYINKNKDAKILVCLHLFYPELWNAISKYLNNLKGYNYDLVVTCSEAYLDNKIIKKIKNIKQKEKNITYPNRGFDIAPFIDVLNKTDLENYDIIFKLHSKGTARHFIYIYEQIFKKDDWFFNLYNGILSPKNTHITIDRLFNDEKAGIVAAENLIVNDPLHKQFFTNSIAKNYNIAINEKYHFIAGTCFAIKAELLKPIKALNLSLHDFEPSKRGEFSLAHAMERIVCACIEPQGYNFCGNLTPHNEYKNLCKKYKKYSALRLLEDERFKIDYEFFYKYLEMTPVKNYEIVRIKLKDIKRDWNGKILSLKECHPYKYLLGETKQYEEYCAENRKFGFYMSEQRFSDLLNKINTNHYDTKLMPILTKDNFIADGQHRACILLYKYGENYEIDCLRLEL